MIFISGLIIIYNFSLFFTINIYQDWETLWWFIPWKLMNFLYFFGYRMWRNGENLQVEVMCLLGNFFFFFFFVVVSTELPTLGKWSLYRQVENARRFELRLVDLFTEIRPEKPKFKNLKNINFILIIVYYWLKFMITIINCSSFG